MKISANKFILHRSKYIERDGKSLIYYQQWVEDEIELQPDFSDDLRTEAHKLLHNNDESIVRSAIQVLACVGSTEDIERLEKHVNPSLAKEISKAIELILVRHKSIEQLLSEVKDAKTFHIFAEALADERERAARIENSNPEKYCIDGALGWKNADISSFIYSGLEQIRRINHKQNPTWKDMAEFLYLGKIHE